MFVSYKPLEPDSSASYKEGVNRWWNPSGPFHTCNMQEMFQSTVTTWQTFAQNISHIELHLQCTQYIIQQNKVNKIKLL